MRNDSGTKWILSDSSPLDDNENRRWHQLYSSSWHLLWQDWKLQQQTHLMLQFPRLIPIMCLKNKQTKKYNNKKTQTKQRILPATIPPGKPVMGRRTDTAEFILSTTESISGRMKSFNLLKLFSPLYEIILAMPLKDVMDREGTEYGNKVTFGSSNRILWLPWKIQIEGTKRSTHATNTELNVPLHIFLLAHPLSIPPLPSGPSVLPPSPPLPSSPPFFSLLFPFLYSPLSLFELWLYLNKIYKMEFRADLIRSLHFIDERNNA